MLTRKIDRALDAMAACKDRVPALREIYRADSPEGLARATREARIGRKAARAGE